MSAFLQHLRRVKRDISAVRAEPREARQPLHRVDAVVNDGGHGDEPGLRLPRVVTTGRTALHRFKGIQLGDHVLDFDGHALTLRCEPFDARSGEGAG